MVDPVPVYLNWLSLVLGYISFFITVLNLLALYGSMVATIKAAPQQMRDTLGNLRQQICEEREAIKHQRQQTRLHNQHNPNAIPLTYSDVTLALHYATLKDLWIQFKNLERPFLIDDDWRAEAVFHGNSWRMSDFEDDKVRGDLERNGENGSYADWGSLYKCDFMHRYIWWRTKDDVAALGEMVTKVMIRRMEREVTQTRLLLMQQKGWGTGGVLGHVKPPAPVPAPIPAASGGKEVARVEVAKVAAVANVVDDGLIQGNAQVALRKRVIEEWTRSAPRRPKSAGSLNSRGSGRTRQQVTARERVKAGRKALSPRNSRRGLRQLNGSTDRIQVIVYNNDGDKRELRRSRRP